MAKKKATKKEVVINKIEFPIKDTYWIAMDGDKYIAHGITTLKQVTESIHELVEYPNMTKWKKAIKGFIPEEDYLEEFDPSKIN